MRRCPRCPTGRWSHSGAGGCGFAGCDAFPSKTTSLLQGTACRRLCAVIVVHLGWGQISILGSCLGFREEHKSLKMYLKCVQVCLFLRRGSVVGSPDLQKPLSVCQQEGHSASPLGRRRPCSGRDWGSGARSPLGVSGAASH